ncbi:hypothetical protein LSTR_LSTR001368, partial [Laodelphax striatellus]
MKHHRGYPFAPDVIEWKSGCNLLSLVFDLQWYGPPEAPCIAPRLPDFSRINLRFLNFGDGCFD